MIKQKTGIEIYTDGSHKGAYGSWAYVMVRGGKVIAEAFGREKNTTSYRMEFQAAIEALKALPKDSKVSLYSDCRDLVDTATLWAEEWKSNGWIKKTGRPIPNVDLIILLDELNSNHKITWKWIKAHSGISYNERCDELCLNAREQL